MAESVIWELTLPEVTLDDIFRAEGADYSGRPPHPSILKMHHRILADAATLVRPKAIWSEFEVTGAGKQELYLKGGYQLTSKLLAKMVGPAEKLLLFAMTIVPELEERVAFYQRAGKMSEAFVLDTAGSTFAALGSSEALGSLEKHYHGEGLKTTFPMGPGHSYWQGLNDQQIIFSLLRAELIGLKLNDSNLIIPRKSVSMVMGVGHNLPELNGRTHCDFCSLRRNCQMNNVIECQSPTSL